MSVITNEDKARQNELTVPYEIYLNYGKSAPPQALPEPNKQNLVLLLLSTGYQYYQFLSLSQLHIECDCIIAAGLISVWTAACGSKSD